MIFIHINDTQMYLCVSFKDLGRQSFFLRVILSRPNTNKSNPRIFIYNVHAFLFGKPNIIEVKSYKIIFSGNR